MVIFGPAAFGGVALISRSLRGAPEASNLIGSHYRRLHSCSPFEKPQSFLLSRSQRPVFFRSDYPKAGAVHVNCAETLNISGLTAPVPIRDSDSWLFRPNSLIFASTSDRTSGLTIFLGFSRFASLASHATGS